MKLRKAVQAVAMAYAVGFAASAVAAVPAPPSGVGDAYLNVTGFTILRGDAGLTSAKGTPLSFVVLPTAPGAGTEIAVISASTSATTSAVMNGAGPVGDATNSTPFATAGVSVGVGGATPFRFVSRDVAGNPFVPGALITGQPTATFAGAASISSGNSLLTAGSGTSSGVGSDNLGHAQVSIATGGLNAGVASSTLTTTASFTFVVAAPILFEMNFDAEAYLRAALGQTFVSATANHTWSTKVTRLSGGITGDVLSWAPNGTASDADLVPVSAAACTPGVTCWEVADTFDMNPSGGAAQITGPGEDVIDNLGAGQVFEADLLLAPGTYTLSLQHGVVSDAITFFVPEPGTVALLGLGLLGLGCSVRRRQGV